MTTTTTFPWQAAQQVIDAEAILAGFQRDLGAGETYAMSGVELPRAIAGAERSLAAAQQFLVTLVGAEQADVELTNRRAYLAKLASQPRRPLFG